MKATRIIKQVLTPAIKLWLHTQLSQVSELEVDIQASDRQIFAGCIPKVCIFASNAVYQGLHVTQIQLTAENIQVNMGAILRGQPLRLLETIPVIGQLIINEQDLNYSLSSNLLSTALNDVLVKLLPEQRAKSKRVSWRRISLAQQSIYLQGVADRQDKPILLELTTGLELLNGQELQLVKIQLSIDHQAENLQQDFFYNIYLGSDVDLEEVQLTSDSLICRGCINVNP